MHMLSQKIFFFIFNRVLVVGDLNHHTQSAANVDLKDLERLLPTTGVQSIRAGISRILWTLETATDYLTVKFRQVKKPDEVSSIGQHIASRTGQLVPMYIESSDNIFLFTRQTTKFDVVPRRHIVSGEKNYLFDELYNDMLYCLLGVFYTFQQAYIKHMISMLFCSYYSQTPNSYSCKHADPQRGQE